LVGSARQGVIATEVPSNVLGSKSVIVKVSNILGLRNAVAKRPLTKSRNAR
jgi:hypothetical protein